jgi:hypothetical protein
MSLPKASDENGPRIARAGAGLSSCLTVIPTMVTVRKEEMIPWTTTTEQGCGLQP